MQARRPVKGSGRLIRACRPAGLSAARPPRTGTGRAQASLRNGAGPADRRDAPGGGLRGPGLTQALPGSRTPRGKPDHAVAAGNSGLRGVPALRDTCITPVPEAFRTTDHPRRPSRGDSPHKPAPRDYAIFFRVCQVRKRKLFHGAPAVRPGVPPAPDNRSARLNSATGAMVR